MEMLPNLSAVTFFSSAEFIAGSQYLSLQLCLIFPILNQSPRYGEYEKFQWFGFYKTILALIMSLVNTSLLLVKDLRKDTCTLSPSHP